MRHKTLLLGNSLFAILLLSLHFAHDALHAKIGTFEAAAGNLIAIVILAVLLAGTVLLSERRSGQIIMLLTALFAIMMPVLHFNPNADLNARGEALLFVWGLIALGVSGLFSLALLSTEIPRVWRGRRDE